MGVAALRILAYEQGRIPLVEIVVQYSRSLFDFDDQNELTGGHRNPLFDRYNLLVERRVG